MFNMPIVCSGQHQTTVDCGLQTECHVHSVACTIESKEKEGSAPFSIPAICPDLAVQA